MRRARTLFFLLVAAAVWLPTLHVFYGVGAPERARLVRTMAEHTEQEGARTSRMRAVNPEWDFMQRTYSVLGLANFARRPDATRAERAGALARIDAIIDDTIASDASLGAKHFLLPYANERPFVDPESRSPLRRRRARHDDRRPRARRAPPGASSQRRGPVPNA